MAIHSSFDLACQELAYNVKIALLVSNYADLVNRLWTGVTCSQIKRLQESFTV